MTKEITESQFYMWRTIFALAHADNIVSNEEIRFMVEALEDVPFNDEQKHMLSKDIAEPQDIVEMFEKITDPNDQADFFAFANKMVWADGNYVKEERDIILKLQEINVKNTNIDDLVGHVNLELERDDVPTEPVDMKEAVISFRDTFLNRLFKGRD